MNKKDLLSIFIVRLQELRRDFIRRDDLLDKPTRDLIENTYLLNAKIYSYVTHTDDGERRLFMLNQLINGLRSE